MTTGSRAERIARVVEREERENRAIRERLLRERPRLRERATQVVAIPTGAVATAPLPDERRTAYLAHLAGIVDEALADPTGDHDGADPDRSLDAASAAASGRICAACRGGCCIGGGDHAYLSADSVRRSLREDPETDRDRLIARWADRLPAESVVDACVNQTATGCALPRELRAELCNTYHCGPLQAWRDAAVDPEERPLALVIRRGYDHLQRTGGGHRAAVEEVLLIDERGVRVVSR